MALRTPQEYVDSLQDGRVVYYRGERVKDVTTHPTLSVAVKHACIDYEMAEDAAHRDLAVVDDPHLGETISRYYHLPRNSDDLLKRSKLIETATGLGRTLVVLIKEIGTDALFALHMVARHMDDHLKTDYLPRVQAFYRHCATRDLAVAVAQTDVKGDRGRPPSQQAHPDYYVRIVEERPDGIVVRGAKIHTSVMTNSNEVIVLPTRNMSEADRDYAVAFAVPADTPGVKMICSPYGAPRHGSFDHPITSQHKMTETLTVFDDVFVPRERVFLQKEWQYAGALAKTFVEFHRFTAISYKLPLTDTLVGAAQLIADYNGLLRPGHIREKITRLIAYTQDPARPHHPGGAGVPGGRGGHRRAQPAAGEHRQAALRRELPRHDRRAAGHQRRYSRHRARRGGPAEPRNPPPHREVPRRPGRGAGGGPPARPQHDFGADGGRLRRLPGGAGDSRRGVHRGRKDDHPPRIRF